MQGGGVDFVVFLNSNLLYPVSDVLPVIGCCHSQFVSITEFNSLPSDTFIDVEADLHLLKFLKESRIKRLLDVNGHFANHSLLTKGENDFTDIDCIFDGELFPINENIFSHVYKNFSQCQFKYYDAALISVNSPIDFEKTFLMLNNCDVVIIFSQFNSPIEKYLRTNAFRFAKIEGFKSFAGNWIFCYRHKPTENFKMYVVTHKKLPPEHIEKFPENYQVIHSGRAISEELGYLGDNSGDNISYLNLYLNEFVAIYWIWKNTSDSIVGISHYRRFFSETEDKNFSYENILTQERAMHFLKEYDILVIPFYDVLSEYDNMISACSVELTEMGLSIIKKHLQKSFPEYVDALDYVMTSRKFYICNMLVTRRNIFDSYCKWLFSFLIDATQEILATIPIQQFPNPPKRLMAYLGERMMTVWLMKNNLRIKELYLTRTPNL